MNSYTVRMIVGNDKCTTITPVDANTPADAALLAEMKWTDITVRIVNVAIGDDCCYTDFTCTNDDHFCCNCDGHLDSDGTCPDCDFN